MLSPKPLTCGTPATSNMLRKRLFSGVSFGYTRWRLPLIWPFALPAEHDRQIVVRVDVRLAQAAAEHHERVIEQRTVAVVRLLQLLHQVREERRVKLVDLDQLLDALGILLVMRNRVVAVGDADFAIGAVAAVAAHRERRDARHVGLPAR